MKGLHSAQQQLHSSPTLICPQLDPDAAHQTTTRHFDWQLSPQLTFRYPSNCTAPTTFSLSETTRYQYSSRAELFAISVAEAATQASTRADLVFTTVWKPSYVCSFSACSWSESRLPTESSIVWDLPKRGQNQAFLLVEARLLSTT